MPETIPFDQRSREVKNLLAVVVPFVFGAIVGVVLGASAAAYQEVDSPPTIRSPSATSKKRTQIRLRFSGVRGSPSWASSA